MIQVWTDRARSGVVNREGTLVRRFSFAYDPNLTPELAVSLTMPVRPESWIVAGDLHPVFAMNLPEGALRRYLTERFSTVLGEADDLELLKITGRGPIGRLRFTSLEDPWPGTDLEAISRADLLGNRDSEAFFEELLRRYARHSGICGVQPKVMVRVEDSPQDPGTRSRVTIQSTTHIVKTWAQEYPELALNEHLCLLAATRAGLPTVTTALSEDRRFLVIDRFDVKEDGSSLGFEDGCVLRGLPSRRKYDSSYEALAKTLRAFVDPAALPAAMRTFFGALALSVLVRNGDAHLKNFGLLYESAERRTGMLAPVYDVVTTTAYMPKDLMALTLAGTKRWPDRKRLAEFGAKACGLSGKTVSEIIEAAAEGVFATLADLDHWVREVPQFEGVGAGMRRAWEEGLEGIASHYWPGMEALGDPEGIR